MGGAARARGPGVSTLAVLVPEFGGSLESLTQIPEGRRENWCLVTSLNGAPVNQHELGLSCQIAMRLERGGVKRRALFLACGWSVVTGFSSHLWMVPSLTGWYMAVQQVGAELMVSLDCVFTAGASLPRRLRCSLCAVL